MKNHYIDSTTNLMSILENNLIMQSRDSDIETQFKLKSITNNELNLIQMKVMNELTNYYTKCQNYYESAFIALSKALHE